MLGAKASASLEHRTDRTGETSQAVRKTQLPVEGFIDSASTYQVVTACALGAPSRCFPWAWMVINDVAGMVCAERVARAFSSPGWPGQRRVCRRNCTDRKSTRLNS